MSRTLGRPVGRVDENIENIIFDYIDKQIESDSPEKAEIRQNKLDEFRKQLKTVRRPTYRSITYETLPTLLSIANLNIKDMYRLAGVEISWLSDEMQELCEASDKLDAKERIRIMNQAIELSPDFWHDSEMLNNQPTTRAINLLWRCNNRSGRRTLEGSLTTPALAKSYSDRKNTTPLSILDLQIGRAHV